MARYSVFHHLALPCYLGFRLHIVRRFHVVSDAPATLQLHIWGQARFSIGRLQHSRHWHFYVGRPELAPFFFFTVSTRCT